MKYETTDKNFPNSGFTLIELLVVLVVMGIIFSIGVNSFSSFSRNQTLNNAGLDIKNILETARSDAVSQIKPSACTPTDQLTGYQVIFTCTQLPPGACPVCQLGQDYEIQANCGSKKIALTSGKLPSNVKFNSTTNAKCPTFSTLSGAVTGSGNVVLTQSSLNQTVSVSSQGLIQ